MIRVDAKAVTKSAQAVKKAAAVGALKGLALQAARHLANEAAARTPIDTGRLRAGWTYEATGALDAVVQNPVPYASFVEFDTRHWISGNIVPGQLFMRHAMEDTEENLPKMVEAHLKEQMGRWFGG